MSQKIRRMWTVLAATVGLLAGLTSTAQAAPLYYQFINYKADKCMSVEGGGSTANGANLVLYNCNGGHEQDWGWVSQAVGEETYFIFINRKSHKCMSVAGGGSTARGAEIIQWSCNDAWEQQWDLDYTGVDNSDGFPIFWLINRKTGLILSTANGGGTANNTRLIQWSYTSGNEQEWARG